MVQMIPPTYQMVRRMHPSVGLNPDFVAGMRNHGNALEAMLLYMQDTWNGLALNQEVLDSMARNEATQPELAAAGYNSNPARLPLYIRRGGPSWRTLIPRETQMYLQIYKSVESLVKFKTAAEPKAQPAPQARRRACRSEVAVAPPRGGEEPKGRGETPPALRLPSTATRRAIMTTRAVWR